MATKKFYHDIDLLNVGQLVGARTQNVTTTERDALAATLGAANEGLTVWDTTQKREFYWDGAQFVRQAVEITGDVIFKGVIDASAALTGQVEAVSGYEYVVGTAGTLTLAGVTFSPSGIAEVGDRVLFTSATQAFVQQRNGEQASETVLGNVRLATQAEALAGTVTDEAITPATLKGVLAGSNYVKQYAATVNLLALTPLTVTHNLGLVDKDSFTVNAMVGGSQVSLDVDSVNANSLTLTSLIAVSGVRVTVQGAAAAV